jgi:hypothetical protein
MILFENYSGGYPCYLASPLNYSYNLGTFDGLLVLLGIFSHYELKRESKMSLYSSICNERAFLMGSGYGCLYITTKCEGRMKQVYKTVSIQNEKRSSHRHSTDEITTIHANLYKPVTCPPLNTIPYYSPDKASLHTDYLPPAWLLY